jgi:RimJ/RimL family protein N-acetyltransferase
LSWKFARAFLWEFMFIEQRYLLDGHENVGLRPGRLLVGTAARWELGAPESVAQQIYAQSLAQSENMEVIEQDKLLAYIAAGMTVVKIGDQNELLGFARLSEDSQDPRRIVVGTWLGIRHPDYKNGSGAAVMQHAAELAFNSSVFPNAREVITRVKADNVGPQRVLQRLGAERENVVPLRSPKTGRLVNVYNLTKVGLRRI